MQISITRVVKAVEKNSGGFVIIGRRWSREWKKLWEKTREEIERESDGIG